MMGRGFMGASLKAMAVVAGIALSPGWVFAQEAKPGTIPGVEWDKKRLERLERNLNKLERTLFQNNASGNPPVLLKPDPEVVALQATVEAQARRIDDLEATLKSLNGQLDNTRFDADQALKTSNSLKGALDNADVRIRGLEDRLSKLEQTQAQAAVPVMPSAPKDPASDFKAAMELMLSGDYPGAQKAFEGFLATYPTAPQAAEAHFRLAETKFLTDDHLGAAQEYAASLQGWPKSKWAAEATLKLASSLIELKATKDACAATVEFDKRYLGAATPAQKQRLNALKTKSKCN